MNKFKKIIQKYYYRYIHWPLYNFFYYKSPIYISSLNFFKIYNDWWHARKDFHRPILKIYKMNVNENTLGSDYFYIETETNNKWLYINIEKCGYKTKWGEYRFENVPYICIIWRNKIKWIIGLEAPLYIYSNYSKTYSRYNDLYWESIIKYNWSFNKDILKTYQHNIWVTTLLLKDTDENGENKKYYKYETILPCLKNIAAEKIIQYYLKKYKEKSEKNVNNV